MANQCTANSAYSPIAAVTAFHNIPHIDINLDPVDPTFKISLDYFQVRPTDQHELFTVTVAQAYTLSYSLYLIAYHHLGLCPGSCVCVSVHSPLRLLHLYLLLLLLSRQKKQTQGCEDSLCVLRFISDTLLLVSKREGERERERESQRDRLELFPVDNVFLSYAIFD